MGLERCRERRNDRRAWRVEKRLRTAAIGMRASRIRRVRDVVDKSHWCAATEWPCGVSRLSLRVVLRELVHALVRQPEQSGGNPGTHRRAA
jgi:hypothetical protein